MDSVDQIPDYIQLQVSIVFTSKILESLEQAKVPNNPCRPARIPVGMAHRNGQVS